MSDVSIVKAEVKDVDLILDFIIKLAEYERMLKYVKATKEDIIESIFEKKQANVLFIKKGSKAIGFAVYFYAYSTFLAKPTLYLEDLFMIEKERNKGYGKKLLKELAKIAVENNCSRFEWSCLEWNEPSINFYEKMGANPLHGWITFRMDGKELEEFGK